MLDTLVVNEEVAHARHVGCHEVAGTATGPCHGMRICICIVIVLVSPTLTNNPHRRKDKSKAVPCPAISLGRLTEEQSSAHNRIHSKSSSPIL
jgi:hypothetical protein